jgi:hypothetical protein
MIGRARRFTGRPGVSQEPSSIEGTASILILVSGLAHAVVNAILKSGRDKMSGRALIDGFSALLVAPAALLLPLPAQSHSSDDVRY